MTAVRSRSLASSPWLNSLDGATEYRHLSKDGTPSREAFLAWAKRHNLIPVYRGRTPLYARADVDAALNTELVDAERKRRAGRGAHVLALAPSTGGVR